MNATFRIYQNKLLLAKHIFFGALAVFIAVIPLDQNIGPGALLYFKALIYCGLVSQLFSEPLFKQELLRINPEYIIKKSLLRALSAISLLLLVIFIVVGSGMHFIIFDGNLLQYFYHLLLFVNGFLFTGLIFIVLYRQILFQHREMVFRGAVVLPFIFLLALGLVFDLPNHSLGFVLPPLLSAFLYFPETPWYLLLINIFLYLYLFLNAYWALQK